MSKINKLYLWVAGIDLKKLTIAILLIKLAISNDDGPEGPPTNP